MSFGAREWFWAFSFLPLLFLAFLWSERRSRTLLARIVAPRLREQLAGSVSHSKRALRFLLMLLALACLIVSLAQPRYGFSWEEAKRKGRDVIIAVDTSRSMLANDLPPNRLARVKLAAQDLIRLLSGDRVGIVAFAGTAFLQAPLTVDYGAVLSSLRELDTDIIPRGGTNIAAAIQSAVDAFGKGESDNRCLVIFTDGEELDSDGVESARKYKEVCRIFTVGAGTAEGSIIPIPRRDGGTQFVKDPSGQIVKSRIDEARLRDIAETGGGFYLALQSGSSEMRQLFENGIKPMKEQEIDARMSRRPTERYQWPLGAGIFLLALSLAVNDRKRPRNTVSVTGRTPRRSSIGMAAVVLLLGWPADAARNPAVEQYQGGNYEAAYEQFRKQVERNPRSEALRFGLGAAAYQKGKYDEALQEFSAALRSEDPKLRAMAEYNLGNTLCQQALTRPAKEPQIRGLKNSIQHYNEALKIRPDDADAKFNRDLVEEMLRKLEQEPPKEEKKQDQSSEQKDQPPQDKKDQDQKEKQGSPPDQPREEPSKEQKTGDQEKPDKQEDQSGAGKNEPDGKEGASGDKEKPADQSGKDKRDAERRGKDKEKEEAAGANPKDQKDGRKEEPSNTPAPPERNLEGEIEAQPSEAGENEPSEPEAADPRDDGSMTEAQARALLKSIEGEDERVPLIERKGAGSVLKDW